MTNTSEEMWERFMELLRVEDPIGPRDEPNIPHKSFIGGVEKYRAIFIKANTEAS